MLPIIGSIFLDYKCNFWCDHCSVGSSPKTVYPMPRELLDKIFDEIASISNIRVIAFTGGEATLRWEELLYGIERTSRAGLIPRLVTNAWWAKNPTRAAETVSELKKAGVQEISTSFDDFHAPFIKVQEIAYALQACLDADIRAALGVIVDKDAEWDSVRVCKEVCAHMGMDPQEFEQRVLIAYDYPTPSGTGAGLDVMGLNGGAKTDGGCDQILTTLSFHPTGQVKACCGHAMFYEPDLTIGNLNREPLSVIIDRAQHNALYWWIHTLGPKNILRRLGVEGDYASICHACQVLLRDHRQQAVDYIVANKDQILVQDLVLNSNLKRIASMLITKAAELPVRESVTAE